MKIVNVTANSKVEAMTKAEQLNPGWSAMFADLVSTDNLQSRQYRVTLQQKLK